MPWPSALEKKLGISLEERATLNSLSTWRVGGKAEYLFVPRNAREAREAFAYCRQERVPTWLIGGGSNILIHQEGLEGLTIWMGKVDDFNIVPGPREKILLEADGGCPTRRLLNFCMSNGYSGLEFATGIHGSVGGALMCNAGAGKESIGHRTEWVETVEEDGTVRRWGREDLRFSYRFSSIAVGARLLTRCCLDLERADRERVRENILRFWSMRSSQPHGARTAGCVFKNPGPGLEPAGMLLDRSGCKTLSVRDARVSPLHANFVENTGSATAWDIWELIQLCRRRVFEASGIMLEMEVNLLGGPWE